MNFMGDMGRVTGYFERLREEGAETGIDFEFDGETGDTLDAHRLAEWALKEHGVGAQDKLVTAQFKRYMEIGEAPSDKASQLKCAEMAGLPADAAAAVLGDDAAYLPETKAKLSESRQRGVSGVPAWFVDDDQVGSGGMPTSDWERILRGVVRNA